MDWEWKWDKKRNIESILEFDYSVVSGLEFFGRWEAKTRWKMKCSKYSSIGLFYCFELKVSDCMWSKNDRKNEMFTLFLNSIIFAFVA